MGIAFLMPVVLLLLFGFGVSLDAEHIPIALVVEQPSADTASLVGEFKGSRYFDTITMYDMREAEQAFRAHRVDAIVYLRQDFARRLRLPGGATIQVIVNGVDANNGRIISGYVEGVWRIWLGHEAQSRGEKLYMPVQIEQRVWFNSELRSRNFLVPGLIALIMTLIGALLTAMVMAREWERGTMETIMVTPVVMREVILGKFLPIIDGKKALMVLHIGPRFSRDLLLGRSSSIQVIVDGRDSNTAAILLNYVNSIIAQFNVEWEKQHGKVSPPARLDIRAWFNPNLVSRWFMVPGIVGLLTLVVTTLVTALSVARERELGTFDQLLVTPFRPVEIVIGKALPGFIIGFFESTVIILLAIFWFQIPIQGNLITIYIGLLLFLLSTVGMGLMISSLSITQQQAILGTFLFLTPAVILSGFATPIANMPPWVQFITFINPMHYFMAILRDVFLEGTPLHLLLQQFWPMAIIGVVNLALSGWLFRRRIY